MGAFNFMKKKAEEKAKKAIKTGIKAKLAALGLMFTVKILPILLVIVTAASIFDWVIELFTSENTPKEIYRQLEIDDVAELIQVKENNGGYYLDFVDGIDDKLDALIETLNTSGEYHNVPKDKKFLKKLIQAEVVTKFPDLGGTPPESSSGFQGAIDIKRVTPNKNVGEMKNTGQGDTNVLEPETSYNDSQITPKEEHIKGWQEGKKIEIYNDAFVYEKVKGKWVQKTYEDSKTKIKIKKSSDITYTGKYEVSEDKLNNTIIIYVEVKGKDTKKKEVTGYIRSSNINLRMTDESEEENKEENSKDDENKEDKDNSSKDNEDKENKDENLKEDKKENKDEDNKKDESKKTSSRAKENKEKIVVGNESEEYTVAIAAGHNNTDDLGARSGELKEEELTIKVAEKVEEIIKERYKNVKVVQTGSTSTKPGEIKVEERKELARNANPDLCIQIHFNAADSPDANGVEAIYKDGDGVSQQLAEILSRTISQEMGLEDRKAGTDLEKCAVGSLGIIENSAYSHFPSVVTEGGFLTSSVDAEVIRNGGTDKYAEGIVKGIKEYLEADHSGYSAYAPGETIETSSIESRVMNMKYLPLEEFNALKEKSVEEAIKYFSLNEDNKLVTLSWSKKGDGTVEIKENPPMDFRTSLQKYTMPYEYLLYYYFDTAGYRGFSEKLADIVINSEIVIALQDNVTTTHTVVENQQSVQVGANAPSGASKDWHTVGTQSDEITENCSTKIDITYIETWCVKVYKDNSYSKKVLNMGDKDEIIVNVPGKVTEVNGEATLSSEEVIESGEKDTGRKDSNGNPIKYSYSVLSRTATTVDSIRNDYDTSGDTKVKEATDKYVDLYIKESMNNRLKEEWFFDILENNEKTANLIDLTKYLMFLASHTDYGVTEFNFEDEFGKSNFSSSGGIYGNTIQEKVWFAVLGAGYSKEAAAGVLGNIEAESGFNADLIEYGSGIGFGLCQWSYGRRTQLEQYAAAKGKSPGDVNTQIEFLIAEITPGGGADGFANYQLMKYHGYAPSDWENATTPEDAAIAFCWTFERPGIPRMDVRTAAARKYYDEFKDKEKPTGGGNVLEVCEQVMNDMISRNVHYSTSNLTWGDIEGASTHPYACCATYVSVVLYKSGLLTVDQLNAYNYNYTGSGGIPDMLAAAGWTQVSHDQIQPGDVINEPGVHALIYAGGNLVYDQNCGVVSSKGRPPIGGPYDAWSRYNGRANVQVWRAP